MGDRSYFRFDDDNKMKYKILSVIKLKIRQAMSQQLAGKIQHDKGENRPHLRHTSMEYTQESIYSLIQISHRMFSMLSSNSTNMMIMRCSNMATREYGLRVWIHTICLVTFPLLQLNFPCNVFFCVFSFAPFKLHWLSILFGKHAQGITILLCLVSDTWERLHVHKDSFPIPGRDG